MPAPASPTSDAETLARHSPKVLLHEHLDGGLRVSTLLDLLHERGLDSPAPDVPRLAHWFETHAFAHSLVDYLKGFDLTVAAMASLPALERVAFEAAEDARADGAVLAEFRIAPLLFEPHGVPAEAAIEAMLAGLAKSPLPSGLILCGMRHQFDGQVARTADLAVRYHGHGVVGFDLAGPEAGFPPSAHADALMRVREAGVPITLHAGEADEAERVLEAADLGAVRIGHGVHLADALADPERRHLVDAVIARGLHLEVCPTSNVHTGAYPSLAAHPITALWRAGVSCSFHTDNRLMSMVSLAQEAQNMVRHCGLTVPDLLQMTRAAADASFLPASARKAARALIDHWADTALPARSA
ncbi:adenosine deaminase [Rubrivivax albus]|uniref:adenosine deaminase n=1 Tax=Rubrivivax albus TaxID=2499835 RepID=A0A3S3SDQ3_9BURK|nr:adenosine deaminase [Rubrivivax albus]RVT52586.1 adenosine deaminase [Rubrivivax albus]